MLTYIQIIGLLYPNVQCTSINDGSIYSDLIWISGDLIPAQATLDAAIFTNLQNDTISSLSDACQFDIISGFTSSALGSPYRYDSGDVDQINLLGTVAKTSPTTANPDGTSFYYAVRPIVNGIIQPKQYIPHTYSQLRQVLDDGANYKLSELITFNTKRNYVYSLTTIEALKLVTWDSVP